MSKAPDTLTVTLRPVGDGPPAAVRFRRALKLLLRTCGLRASWPTASEKFTEPIGRGEAPDPVSNFTQGRGKGAK